MPERTLVGASALEFNGLVSFYPGLIYQTTGVDRYDGFRIMRNELFYFPSIDRNEQYIRSRIRTPISEVRVPTPERAIMDYIQNIERFDISFLYDGIEEYGRIHKKDWSKLYEVAEHYGLVKELEYHIKEAYETSSGGLG